MNVLKASKKKLIYFSIYYIKYYILHRKILYNNYFLSIVVENSICALILFHFSSHSASEQKGWNKNHTI